MILGEEFSIQRVPSYDRKESKGDPQRTLWVKREMSFVQRKRIIRIDVKDSAERLDKASLEIIHIDQAATLVFGRGKIMYGDSVDAFVDDGERIIIPIRLEPILILPLFVQDLDPLV
jgi:hypothetical protein